MESKPRQPNAEIIKRVEKEKLELDHPQGKERFEKALEKVAKPKKQD